VLWEWICGPVDHIGYGDRTPCGSMGSWIGVVVPGVRGFIDAPRIGRGEVELLTHRGEGSERLLK
jgi:hypothetical protein